MNNTFNVVILNSNPSYDSFISKIFEQTFGQTVQLFKGDKIGMLNPKNCDLVVFTGGEDVTPAYYQEKVNPRTHFNKNRDAYETDMFHIFLDCPKLGICRGSQFLTVMNNGKLIQHVENHAIGHEHSVKLKSKKISPLPSLLNITSTHHQMMYPFNLDKENYEIIGFSEFFRSDVYLNGEDTNIKVPGDFVECEIVYYPKSKSLCIQGHPEYMDYNSKDVQTLVKIIKNYLL